MSILSKNIAIFLSCLVLFFVGCAISPIHQNRTPTSVSFPFTSNQTEYLCVLEDHNWEHSQSLLDKEFTFKVNHYVENHNVQIIGKSGNCLINYNEKSVGGVALDGDSCQFPKKLVYLRGTNNYDDRFREPYIPSLDGCDENPLLSKCHLNVQLSTKKKLSVFNKYITNANYRCKLLAGTEPENPAQQESQKIISFLNANPVVGECRFSRDEYGRFFLESPFSKELSFGSPKAQIRVSPSDFIYYNSAGTSSYFKGYGGGGLARVYPEQYRTRFDFDIDNNLIDVVFEEWKVSLSMITDNLVQKKIREFSCKEGNVR